MRAAMLAGVLALGACKAPPEPMTVPPQPGLPPAAATDVTLTKGDVIEVAFFKSYANDGPYRIGVSDKLLVSVENRPELRHEAVVLPDATCTLPLIGPVAVDGKTVVELEQELERRYGERFDRPDVSVLVTGAHGRLEDFFTIMSQTARGPVLEATVTAEGRLELPLVGSVPAKGLPLSELRRTVSAAYAAAMPGLQAVVNLLRREQQLVTVLGEVTRPGGFPVAESMTLMRALAMAGGTTDRAWLSQVLVVRPRTDGSLSVDVHDLDVAFEGKEGLEWLTHVVANDVVYVPRSPIADANVFVEQYIRNLIPIPAGFGIAIDVTN